MITKKRQTKKTTIWVVIRGYVTKAGRVVKGYRQKRTVTRKYREKVKKEKAKAPKPPRRKPVPKGKKAPKKRRDMRPGQDWLDYIQSLLAASCARLPHPCSTRVARNPDGTLTGELRAKTRDADDAEEALNAVEEHGVWAGLKSRGLWTNGGFSVRGKASRYVFRLNDNLMTHPMRMKEYAAAFSIQRVLLWNIRNSPDIRNVDSYIFRIHYSPKDSQPPRHQ